MKQYCTLNTSILYLKMIIITQTTGHPSIFFMLRLSINFVLWKIIETETKTETVANLMTGVQHGVLMCVILV